MKFLKHTNLVYWSLPDSSHFSRFFFSFFAFFSFLCLGITIDREERSTVSKKRLATKEEIKSLLETEIGPLKMKLSSIERAFSELEKSVKHFSTKYDELLSKQVQRSNDRAASLSADVKNLKEDMKLCKKFKREIEDLSQYMRRDCLEVTGVLPTQEVTCSDLVCTIGKKWA